MKLDVVVVVTGRTQGGITWKWTNQILTDTDIYVYLNVLIVLFRCLTSLIEEVGYFFTEKQLIVSSIYVKSTLL